MSLKVCNICDDEIKNNNEVIVCFKGLHIQICHYSCYAKAKKDISGLFYSQPLNSSMFTLRVILAIFLSGIFLTIALKENNFIISLLLISFIVIVAVFRIYIWKKFE